ADWVIEPRHQFCKRAFARPVLAGHGEVFARQDSKSRDLKHVPLSSIAKLDSNKFDLWRVFLRKVDCSSTISYARAQRKSRLHLPDTGEGFLGSRIEVS